MTESMVTQRLRREVHRMAARNGSTADETVVELAAHLKLNAHALEVYLMGWESMPMNVFVGLCDALGVPGSTILNDDGKRKAVKTASRAPALADADAWGFVLTWQPRVGWTVTDWRVVANSMSNGLGTAYPYWMQLPDPPEEWRMHNGSGSNEP